MTLKERLFSFFGGNHSPQDRPSVVGLRAREQLAEEQVEVALNGMRAVRAEYDPRLGIDRKRKLDSLNDHIEQQRAHIATLKGSLTDG